MANETRRAGALMVCWMATSTTYWVVGLPILSAVAALTAIMYALSGAFDG